MGGVAENGKCFNLSRPHPSPSERKARTVRATSPRRCARLVPTGGASERRIVTAVEVGRGCRTGERGGHAQVGGTRATFPSSDAPSTSADPFGLPGQPLAGAKSCLGSSGRRGVPLPETRPPCWLEKRVRPIFHVALPSNVFLHSLRIKGDNVGEVLELHPPNSRLGTKVNCF